jgi:hypothetical protein
MPRRTEPLKEAHTIMVKRIAWSFLGGGLCAALVWTAEPSGGSRDGAGSGTNRTVGASAAEKTAPWPEPDPAAVKKLDAELRGELPASQFHFTQVGPWLVATDMDSATTQRFLRSSIGYYAARIQKQLFDKPLAEPVKVYLFKDKQSYETWTAKLCGEHPNTPYGWYSRQKRGMYMNIGTGGGTLIHEMVHAMTEADWPEIPPWLNEGLGSLYEACSRAPDGRVIGITNWRHTGLLNLINRNAAPRFSELLRMNDDAFYGPSSGANYAAARYLMQYLQSKGKLEEFYKRVRDRKDDDARASLRFSFDNKFTVDEIEKSCYDWVKMLRQQ